MVRLSFWGQNEVNEADIECYVTLTRYTDMANNSDKWRRIFTIHAPGFRPYTWTQTGRWTHMTASGIWSGGTMRPGKVVSQAAWNRGGNHVGLHRNEVNRQRKDYTVASAIGESVPWAEAKAYLARLSPNPVSNGAAGTPVQTRPHILLQAQQTENRLHSPTGTHLANRINALVASAMDENTDPLDLFADLAMLKNELAEVEKDVDKMRMDLKLANETILNRVV